MDSREFCENCDAQRDADRDDCWRWGSRFATATASATRVEPVVAVPEPPNVAGGAAEVRADPKEAVGPSLPFPLGSCSPWWRVYSASSSREVRARRLPSSSDKAGIIAITWR